MPVETAILLNEIKETDSENRISVDYQCAMLEERHKTQECESEHLSNKIGSTKSGVGACNAERALRAGARGYLTKQEATHSVLTGIRRVLSGEIYLNQKTASTVLGRLAAGHEVGDGHGEDSDGGDEWRPAGAPAHEAGVSKAAEKDARYHLGVLKKDTYLSATLTWDRIVELLDTVPMGRKGVYDIGDTLKPEPLTNFDLYLVDLDGTGLEQVTTSPEFDAFPMFSPDGKHLVWASNRHGKVLGETNIFIADWVERP